MSNETKKTALPKLQFPEFEEAGEWEVIPLGELIDGVSKRNRDKKINRVFTNSAVSGIVDQRDFFDKDIATKGNTDNYSIVALGDYVYNPRISEFAPVGPTSRNKLGEGIVSPLYTVFRFHNRDNEFYEHYFKSTSWQKSLKAIGNMGARHDRMGISLTQLRLVEVSSPSLEEQQKIAATLSSLDDLITAQNAKLAALQAHKRGLMQGLFPAEGETVPKLRFPEFQEAEEWEEKTLGEVLEFIMGNAFRSDEFTEDGVQLIRMGNLYQGELQLSRAPVFLPKAFKNKYSNFLVNPSDLLMSMTGTLGKRDYGFIVQVPEGCSDLFLNQRVLKIIPKESCIKEFVLQQMKQEVFLDKLYFMPGGTKQVNLSVKHLCEIRIPFPQILEQQKIADCLTSLDDRITAQRQKIEALKLHKKGLMQNLFPAAAEPTV